MVKDRLLHLWHFLVARPGPMRVLRCCHAAAVAWGNPRKAAALWAGLVADWPGGDVPELVRAGQRRALLAAWARTQDRDQRTADLVEVLRHLGGPHALKCDVALLAALASHVAQTLPKPEARPFPKGGSVRRLALCLDILKSGGEFTHGRVVLSICANLLAADPGLHIDLVITQERQAAGAGPCGADAALIADLAKRFLAAEDQPRLGLHVLALSGIEAVLGACRLIQSLNPDLLLFGGGHRGPVSNESRVVRHCLFARFPVAFFFFQASDQVDECCDLIIARGPHRIEGRPGSARVRVQPYPTLLASEPRPRAVPPRPQDAPPLIVSAIVGARMEARLDELGQRKLARFLALLDDRPGAVWHFIGSSNPERLIRGNRTLRARVARGQVVVHPVLTAESYRALVGQASLFLHLPGFTGGSGGASVARRAGVPILTFRHSDVAGRQPPETVFEEDQIAACIALARRLLADPRMATEISALQAVHNDTIRATAAAGFLACLDDARTQGAARLLAQGDGIGADPSAAVPAPSGKIR